MQRYYRNAGVELLLLLVSILKALSEILAFSMLGQGVLWLIAGRARDTNFVYKMFATITRPVMRVARMAMPRFVLDRHIWMVAVLIVLVLWVVSSQQKLKICVSELPEDPLCAEITKKIKERRTAE